MNFSPGRIGAFLREEEEALYTSRLTAWRKESRKGRLDGRGVKQARPVIHDNRRLVREGCVFRSGFGWPNGSSRCSEHFAGSSAIRPPTRTSSSPGLPAPLSGSPGSPPPQLGDALPLGLPVGDSGKDIMEDVSPEFVPRPGLSSHSPDATLLYPFDKPFRRTLTSLQQLASEGFIRAARIL